MSIEHLTSQQLRQAADLTEKIETLKTELAGLIGYEAAAQIQKVKRGRPAKLGRPAKPAVPGKRIMSAAHKAKIRAAQAIRWAKHHAAKATTSDKSAKPGKGGAKQGGMSAAGRARIAEAQKLRWSKVKAAKTSEAPAKSEAKPAKKRKMSAAGRARIIAAVKARWAKVKAAQGRK